MPSKPKYGHVGDVVELRCVDCGTTWEWTVTFGGVPFKRCPSCWEDNERKVDREYARRWREAHPDRMREINRESYRRRGGYAAIRAKESRDPEFRARRRSAARKYFRTPEGSQVHRNARLRRRRALQEKGGRMLRHSEWVATLEAFGNQCAYCGCSDKELTRDHFVPVTEGGLTILGNIVPACAWCNSTKHNSLPEVFLSTELYSSIVKVLCKLSQS